MGAIAERRTGVERRTGADRCGSRVEIPGYGFERRKHPKRRLPTFEEVVISDSEWERYFASVAKRLKAAN